MPVDHAAALGISKITDRVRLGAQRYTQLRQGPFHDDARGAVAGRAWALAIAASSRGGEGTHGQCPATTPDSSLVLFGRVTELIFFPVSMSMACSALLPGSET